MIGPEQSNKIPDPDPPAVEHIRALLGGESFGQQLDGAYAISEQCGAGRGDFFLAAERIRAIAVATAVVVRRPEAAEHLAEFAEPFLRDPVREVVIAAMHLASQAPGIFPRLLDTVTTVTLTTPHQDVRTVGCHLLAQYGTDREAVQLLRSIERFDETGQYDAFRGVRGIISRDFRGSGEFQSVLYDLLAHPDPWIRSNSADIGLDACVSSPPFEFRLAGTITGLLGTPESYDGQHAEALEMAGRLGEPAGMAVPLIVPFLADRRPALRIPAAAALAIIEPRTAPSSVLGTLLGALSVRLEQHREAAVCGLGSLLRENAALNGQVADPLDLRLVDRSASVRLAAAHALSFYRAPNDQRARRIVATLLESEPAVEDTRGSYLVASAFRNLSHLPACRTAREVIERLSRHPHHLVAAQAAAALERLAVMAATY